MDQKSGLSWFLVLSNHREPCITNYYYMNTRPHMLDSRSILEKRLIYNYILPIVFDIYVEIRADLLIRVYCMFLPQ